MARRPRVDRKILSSIPGVAVIKDLEKEVMEELDETQNKMLLIVDKMVSFHLYGEESLILI